MSLLGWLVGAALVDEWGRREEEEEARKEAECKMLDLRRQNDANTGLARTAKRWTDVNGYLRMEFYMTASVSTVEAGGVVATETFSTTMSAMSFFSSPTNDVETIDIEKGAYDIK